MHTFVHTHALTYMHTHTFVHTHSHKCTHTHSYTHTHIYAHAHIRTHNTHTHTREPSPILTHFVVCRNLTELLLGAPCGLPGQASKPAEHPYSLQQMPLCARFTNVRTKVSAAISENWRWAGVPARKQILAFSQPTWLDSTSPHHVSSCKLSRDP